MWTTLLPLYLSYELNIMIIDPKTPIAGYPSLSIRKLLKKSHSSLWDAAFIEHVLGLDRNQSEILIKTLEDLEFIAREKERKKPLWCNTIKGNALANAPATKPITRKTADKKIEELLQRVNEVNNSDYFLFKVGKVCIFGSYLENKERIGDVDVAIKLLPKEADIDKHHELQEKRTQEIINQRSYPFRSFLEELAFPREEVMKYLKNRSTALSLRDISELEELEKLGAKYRVIFEIH